MPLNPGDIAFRYSNSQASAPLNDSSDPPVPGRSGNLDKYCLGGWVSTIPWTGGDADLFDDITGSENIGFATDYRCVFLVNLNFSLTLYNAIVYITAQQAGGADCEIGLDTTGVVPLNSPSLQSLQIANETQAPFNIPFFQASTRPFALEIGDVPPRNCIGIWIKRQAQNSPAMVGDYLTIRVEGDTA